MKKILSLENSMGFTLLEMLVVIGIIAILVTLGFSSYTAIQKSSRDAKRKADLEQIRAALEMYSSNNDAYPVGSWENLSDLTAPTTYIQSLPTDPKNPTYTYYYSSSGGDYVLGTYLETSSGSCGGSCSGGECNYCLDSQGIL